MEQPTVPATTISIVVESCRPPTGRVETGEHEPEAFDGWLQLLRILADALGDRG